MYKCHEGSDKKTFRGLSREVLKRLSPPAGLWRSEQDSQRRISADLWPAEADLCRLNSHGAHLSFQPALLSLSAISEAYVLRPP